jgi:uncharacterized protein (DUF2147 family)
MLALPIIVLLAAADATDPAILGTWLTESGHGVIEIVRCANAMCGGIVAIDRTPDEPMPTDVTGRSQCSLTIISDVTQPRMMRGTGKIVDPRDGATYHAKLWVDSEGRLNLRGYVGISLLGRRHGEPHQRMSARPVRRPHVHRDHASQPARRSGRASPGAVPRTVASNDVAGSSI